MRLFALLPLLVVPALSCASDAPAVNTKSAIALYKSQQYKQAEQPLRAAAAQGGELAPFLNYDLADTLMHNKKYDEAASLLQSILKQRPLSQLKYKSLFLLSQINVEQKKWKAARSALRILQRHWSYAKDYPEVLLLSLHTDVQLNRLRRACYLAKKLYVRYPTHDEVAEWPANLRDLKIDGKKVGCSLRTKDFESRIRHLQLAGHSDRARKEIDEIRAGSPKALKPKFDLVLAKFLVNEGLVEDALNLLVRYYPKMKGNFNYLNLLAKAAGRAGEYQTAVGAYEKAHALSPRSLKGREALFEAAFLSYQFEDYDGAATKFEKFIKEYPRSGLSRDAKWHLAWLQYLRSDFKGALKQFKEVRKESSHRRGFQGSSRQQRLIYWAAMANLRMGLFKKARSGFQSLVDQNPYGYYAVAATARMAQLPKVPKVKVKAEQRTPTSIQVPPVADVQKNPPADSEEEESEDTIGNDTDQADTDAEQDEKALEESDPIQPGDDLEPALQARLKVAKQLISVGMIGFAKWELWEIERRVRQPADWKMLIQAYQQSGIYHRSAAIAELDFVHTRFTKGLSGAKDLWLAMFPKAFRPAVEKAADAQQIPDDWVWSIMRAESRYRTDVTSSVGAKGLMQLMPFTAMNLARLSDRKGFAVEDLFDPSVNIALGAQYLARLSREFKGSLPLVAAAYNAGPQRVQSWLVSFGYLETDEFIEHIPFLQTRNYVKKVVLNHYFYRALYGKDTPTMAWLAEPLGVPIPSKVPFREDWGSI